jgi:hypothetical protein
MPTTGTVSGATGVISTVLLSAVVVLGILLDRRLRLPGQPRFAGSACTGKPVPASLVRRARRAATDCPALALKLITLSLGRG